MQMFNKQVFLNKYSVNIFKDLTLCKWGKQFYVLCMYHTGNTTKTGYSILLFDTAIELLNVYLIL